MNATYAPGTSVVKSAIRVDRMTLQHKVQLATMIRTLHLSYKLTD